MILETLSHLAVPPSLLTHIKAPICHRQYDNGQYEAFVSNLHGKRCP